MTQQSSDMVELVARAMCWADDCESGACQNAGRCMAENLNETFYFDANTILRACHHAELVEDVRLALDFIEGAEESIREKLSLGDTLRAVLAKLGGAQ